MLPTAARRRVPSAELLRPGIATVVRRRGTSVMRAALAVVSFLDKEVPLDRRWLELPLPFDAGMRCMHIDRGRRRLCNYRDPLSSRRPHIGQHGNRLTGCIPHGYNTIPSVLVGRECGTAYHVVVVDDGMAGTVHPAVGGGRGVTAAGYTPALSGAASLAADAATALDVLIPNLIISLNRNRSLCAQSLWIGWFEKIRICTVSYGAGSPIPGRARVPRE